MFKRVGVLVCLIGLIGGCSTLGPQRPLPQVEIKSRHETFDLSKAGKAKIAILPLRDFSDHFGFAYSTTAMNTFTEEFRKKFPELELADSNEAAKLAKSVGKGADYKLFVDKCINDNKYCVEKNELLNIFKDSGVNYVVSMTVGTLNVPGPVSMMVYYLSTVIYDIDLGGEVVYNAFSQNEIYLSEEDTNQLLINTMQEISREIVAKM
jgi:hypothetical protein